MLLFLDQLDMNTSYLACPAFFYSYPRAVRADLASCRCVRWVFPFLLFVRAGEAPFLSTLLLDLSHYHHLPLPRRFGPSSSSLCKLCVVFLGPSLGA